jgi:hypothetical protein
VEGSNFSGTASFDSLRSGAIATLSGAVVTTGLKTVRELFGACNCAGGAGCPDDRLQHDSLAGMAQIAGAVCRIAIIVAQQACAAPRPLIRQFASPAAGMASSAPASTTATNLQRALIATCTRMVRLRRTRGCDRYHAFK